MSGKRNNESAFTIIEALIGAAISMVALGVGFVLLQNAARNQAQADRAARRNQAQALFERQIGSVLTSMSDAVVSPTRSFLWQSDRHVAVGATWNRADGAVGDASTPKLTLAGFETFLGSHIISDYRLSVTAAQGTVGRDVKNFFISRCVDGRSEPSTYSTLAQILALKAPIVRAGKIFCCDIDSSIGAVDLNSCTNSVYNWPTTFMLNRNGGIEKTPADVDRQGVPGMGFVLSFDRNPPDVYHVDYLYVVNRCSSGAALRSTKCPATIPGPGVEKNELILAEELKIDIKRVSNPISSDITGGSFIKLGPKSIEVK